MATTQLEVLALWTRARRETDPAARQSYLSEAEQLTSAEGDPREQQFARRVLTHFQRWMQARGAGARHEADLRYRMSPPRW
jgi:hypothetical protein